MTEEELKNMELPVPQIPERTVKAEDYPTIQAAVDACSALGGGRVDVGPGIHPTGPIRLRSRIELHLAEEAELLFSSDPDDYLPVVFTRWEGTECYNYCPLVYARGCIDIALTGKGKLNGNGRKWWHWKRLQQDAANRLVYAEADGIPVEQRVFGTKEAALRPSFIEFIDCKNVLWQDFRIENGPMWTLHPVYCENVIVRGIDVNTCGPNTDGLNPDSCSNVLIEHCRFFTGDDCVAVNSGMNEDGWRVGKPCENVVVRHCEMNGGHGGVTIGSAISGGVRNILFYDCRISGTVMGFRMKSMRGRGGVVENIIAEKLTIDRQQLSAIQITMFYGASTVIPRQNTPSVFRNIHLSDISGTGAAYALEVVGLPEQHLQKITLEKIHLAAENSATLTDIDDLVIRDLKIEPGVPAAAAKEEEY